MTQPRRKNPVLWAILAFAALNVGTSVFFSQFPTADECAASGREVDAGFRYCDSLTERVTLREHALEHGKQVLIGAGVLAAVGYVAWGFRKRRTKT